MDNIKFPIDNNYMPININIVIPLFVLVLLNTETPSMLLFRLILCVLLSLQTALFWCFSIQLSNVVQCTSHTHFISWTLVFFPVSSGKVSFPLGSSTQIVMSWMKSHILVILSFPIQVFYFLVLLYGRAHLLQH